MEFSPTKPILIAEIGVNHEGSIQLCHKLIDQALNYGIHDL